MAIQRTAQLMQKVGEVAERVYDPSLLEQEREFDAIVVPVKQLQKVIKQMSEHLLVMPNIDRVQPRDKDSRLLVLNKKVEGLPFERTTFKVGLSEKNYSYKQICEIYLRRLKAEGVEVPTGHETVGHIAHFNLDTSQVPYQRLFGQVLLSKSRLLRTVVNKVDKLDNEFRTPQLVLMAGEPDYEVTLKEQGAIFHFNFQKVYWCSRLQVERDRLLAKYFRKGQTLLDLFCGVGPMAVRAAKQGLNVVANDLNPEAYPYIVKNAKANHVEHFMLIENRCAREVIRQWTDPEQRLNVRQKFRQFHQVFMNLPVLNIDFLGEFVGMRRRVPGIYLPQVHLTCFVKPEGRQSDEWFEEQIIARIRRQLPHFSRRDVAELAHIKNVTVKMRMYCVSFRISQLDADLEPGPLRKAMRLE